MQGRTIALDPCDDPTQERLTRPSCGSTWRRTRTSGCSIEHAHAGILGGVFDHVGIAVADLAASERFYRTVLSVLGAEPSHADAELVDWDD